MTSNDATVLKTRVVRSGFGIHYVKNSWTDEDWDSYHFNLNLRESIGYKAIREHRELTSDERKFFGELEARNDAIRQKYMHEHDYQPDPDFEDGSVVLEFNGQQEMRLMCVKCGKVTFKESKN